jgi:hypothetical protein
MQRPVKQLLVLLTCSLALANAAAQDAAYVQVQTNLPDALVFADSARVGRASQGLLAIPARAQMLRLVPPKADVWSMQPIETPLDAQPGDTVVVQLDFDYHYQIESVPFGARVSIEAPAGRTVLGQTPLLYTAPQPLLDTLLVERQGYRPARLVAGREVWNRHLLTLEPLRATLDAQQPTEIAWQPPKESKRWIDYAAAGLAVAAGVVAIHYKFKADRLYDEYQETGDPALRPQIERYDDRSAIALGTMQVGLGVLIVRFALR